MLQQEQEQEPPKAPQATEDFGPFEVEDAAGAAAAAGTGDFGACGNAADHSKEDAAMAASVQVSPTASALPAATCFVDCREA